MLSTRGQVTALVLLAMPLLTQVFVSFKFTNDKLSLNYPPWMLELSSFLVVLSVSDGFDEQSLPGYP